MIALIDDPKQKADAQLALEKTRQEKDLQLRTYKLWQFRWSMQRRRNQVPPPGDWDVWAFVAGRGAGKTRTAAEWIGARAVSMPGSNWFVVGRTTSDMRKVCFEGDSGLINVVPEELIVDYRKAPNVQLELYPIKGKKPSILLGFGAEQPEAFRGPQGHGSWLDELAAWQYAQDSWDMIQMGMRLGRHPQQIVTTTPRPKPLISAIVKKTLGMKVEVTTGSSYENRANLAPNFMRNLEQYEGTRLGEQEIHAVVFDPEETGIIRRSWWQLWDMDKMGDLPALDWVVMSLDTAFTEAARNQKTGDADYTACTVWGFFKYKKRRDDKHVQHGAILLDAWQDRLGLPDLITEVKKKRLVRYGEDWQDAVVKPAWGSAKPIDAGRPVDMIVIEEKGSGISLRQMLEKEGIFTWPYNPGRADKLERLHSVSHIFANGLVWVPAHSRDKTQPRGFAQDCVTQVCSYSGKGSLAHDDYVDGVTQALRYFIDRSSVSVTVKPPEEEYDPKEHKPTKNPYGT